MLSHSPAPWRESFDEKRQHESHTQSFQAANAAVIPFGNPPVAPVLRIHEVGRDRLVAERQIEFALALEAGSSESAALLARLSMNAWWATRQSFRSDGVLEPELDRLMRALDRLASEAPDEVRRFRYAATLIADCAAQGQAAERRLAVIRAVEGVQACGDVLVLARNAAAAAHLQVQMAAHFGLSVEELAEIGIRVQSYRAEPPPVTPGATVMTGYFGRDMLDALLKLGTPKVHCVFDPVEIRAAWFGARELTRLLRDIGLSDAARPVDQVGEQLRPHVTGFADTIELPLSFDVVQQPESELPMMLSTGAPRDTDPVTLFMTSGEYIHTHRNARFDVLPNAGGGARTLAAWELCPGDRVVLIDYDQHSTFSARLIAELDRGLLLKESQQRVLWSILLAAARSQPEWSLPNVIRAMGELGVRVDDTTVRSWLRPGREDLLAVSVPRQRAAFLAFAQAMQIPLTEAALLSLWNSIRRWRTLHRKAGRDLARLIRAVSVNRLDAPSLARVEEAWGLCACQLLQAARVAVIDEVIPL